MKELSFPHQMPLRPGSMYGCYLLHITFPRVKRSSCQPRAPEHGDKEYAQGNVGFERIQYANVQEKEKYLIIMSNSILTRIELSLTATATRPASFQIDELLPMLLPPIYSVKIEETSSPLSLPQELHLKISFQ